MPINILSFTEEPTKNLTDYLAEVNPQIAYEGGISAYEDEMDYVTVSLKGAVIA